MNDLEMKYASLQASHSALVAACEKFMKAMDTNNANDWADARTLARLALTPAARDGEVG